MELGYALPTSGVLATPENISRIATTAERIGYDSLWTYERLLRPVDPVVPIGGGEPQPVPDMYTTVFEPLVTLSHVAALTERIKLGTSVIDALLHPPVVLARRFATLDRFSGGRVVAGVGQGWMRPEFETANVPMSRMGAGFEEVVTAMKACWGPDPVAFKGRFYTIVPSEVNPKPAGRIPVLVGAMTPAGIRRAARIADGLNPVVVSRDSLLGAAQLFREGAKDEGRDPSALTVVGRANVPLSDKPLGKDRPFLGGSPEQIADDLASLRGTGIDQIFFANMTASDIDEEVHFLERIKEAALSAE
ncbi:TIGR03619 family F420-dependent LLM class oxidoreductase [Streptomyces sp. NBC_00102]|uniref:TIGR03619 family F420-dependent LLM class oxidoreductase n=1 Tax=Streptomyces sp. NBC_00102 TaxID=2975652 RepID=UPI0022529B90|nr:TIGR03619 family F420-dependent LLM class oxidoreductase [Streptomyces sp. NBC_00102]MCX5399877.1 TIGR03619 family F420-dependent LLM class oxidoreductase [Streptomyces sp. NBC_00102]